MCTAAEWTGQQSSVRQRGVWLKDANLLRSAVLLPGAPGVPEAAAAAFLSSSSLSDPPEELLSEATRGAFLPSPTGQVPEEALTSADRQKAGKIGFQINRVLSC